MRAHFRYWLFRLALLFMTVAPAFAEEAAPPVTRATPALWTVHGPRGTAYLLGSIHALPENMEWQTPAIKAAIRHANAFVFEVPMADDSRSKAALLLGANELLPPSISLPSYFDAEMRSEFRAAVEHTQVDPETLVVMRPWWAAKIFDGAMSGKIPLYAKEGVDNKVYAIAKDHGIRDVRAFESDEFQLHMMKGNANTHNELEILRVSMRQAARKSLLPFGKLLDAWKAGDPAAIAAANFPGMSPEEKKTVLDDRNRNWIPKIEKMLTEKRTFFITVGAAHLVGPGGVPNLLRAAGYRVDGPDLKS